MNLSVEIQKLVNAHVKEIERDIVQRIVESATSKIRKPKHTQFKAVKTSKPLGMLSNGAPKSNGTSKPAKVACQGKLPGGGICGSKTHGLSRHNQAMTMQAKYRKAKARVAHA